MVVDDSADLAKNGARNVVIVYGNCGKRCLFLDVFWLSANNGSVRAVIHLSHGQTKEKHVCPVDIAFWTLGGTRFHRLLAVDRCMSGTVSVAR